MSETVKGEILHRTRSQLASLFSDMFSNPPEAVQLESLVYLLGSYFEHEHDDNDCYFKGLDEYEEWRAGAEQLSGEEQQLIMQKNYTRLFCVGRGVGTTASAVLSPQRVHKWEPWSKVRRFYYEHGLRLAEDSTLYEDSIVTELAFYSLLIDQLVNLSDSETRNQFKVQQRFLRKHLLIWLPRFCEELHNAAGRESAYSSIASFLNGYMLMEPRLLEQFLQPETS